MLKVLHVGSFSGYNNGPFQVILGLQESGFLKDIQQEVFNLRKVTNEDPIHKTSQIYKLKIHSARSITDLSYFFNQYDVLHFHGIFHPQLIKYSKVPFEGKKVWTPHGNLNFDSLKKSKIKKMIYLWLNQDYIKGFDTIHALTEYEKANLLKQNIEQKIVVIGNGIYDNSQLSYKTNIQKRLELGYIGRIDIYTKGLDRLLKGFEKINVPATLHIAGLGDDKESVKVLDYINQSIKRDSIKTYPILNGKQKYKFMSSKHFMVLPSRNEGQPLVALESIGVNTPVLVTPETNLSPLIDEYNCGILFEEDRFYEVVNNKIYDVYEQLQLGCINAIKGESWENIAKQYSYKLYRNEGG